MDQLIFVGRFVVGGHKQQGAMHPVPGQNEVRPVDYDDSKQFK